MSNKEPHYGPDSSENPVHIRRYEPADRNAVLALDEAVWDRQRSESWFAWKYERNPYVNQPAVFVAESNDQIVGARPFLAFRLRIDDRSVDALQPSDTMVHPAYRGRGIFTRMTKRAIEYYATREPRLCFNFPNRMARPGYLKLGWQRVGDRRTYYRIQRPVALASNRAIELDGETDWTSHVDQQFTRVVDDISRGYRALRNKFELREEFSVERVSDTPVETLVTLYRRSVPAEIHALRDAEFYRWRFASPAWERETYLATRDGRVVAGIVVRTRETEGSITLTQFGDVAPLCGGEQWRAALETLVRQITRDYAESDLIAAPNAPIPREILRAYGFLRNDSPPLSWLKDYDRALVIRSLDDVDGDTPILDDDRLTDSTNWLLGFPERDTV